MVAKVSTGTSIRRMLQYNENKVLSGAAYCLHENLFGQRPANLSFHQKLQGLERFAERNRRATSKAVHISLNFHPDDRVDDDKLTSIADQYMDRIGFSLQPYLVYRHTDAGHPHIHIVTTNIRQDGSRMILFNIGRNESAKARLEIEKDYKLITAVGRGKGKVETEHPRPAVYGKVETRRAISNAVSRALQYKFTSLPEFNAILKQYNVIADRGKEGSFLFGKRGLLFFITDTAGNKQGVPIKASSFHNKPTLKNLEVLFKKNEPVRMLQREALKRSVDQALGDKSTINRRDFIKALNRQKIFVLFRLNPQGLTYGVTFVDNSSRVVFNGSDLGKNYSARALEVRLIDPPGKKYFHNAPQQALDLGLEQVAGELITAQQYDSGYNPHLKRKRKRPGHSR